jgi:site-specific DNA-adenine methylase
MRSFFPLFGAKWALARRYGPPQHAHVVEPFAGSAGYSTYWEPKKVTLIDKDPRIVGIWRYLQRASRQEIMRLPTAIESVDQLRVCQEAKDLIGFWFDHGTTRPAQRRRCWARDDRYASQFWGQQIRVRIAQQLDKIRHWQIIEGDYSKAPDLKAHHFIDPPYAHPRNHYPIHHSIDYQRLAKWCRQRKGYVQVCENAKADWLPFTPFAIAVDSNRLHRVTSRSSVEVLYERPNPAPLFSYENNRAKTPHPHTPRPPAKNHTPNYKHK